MPAVTDPAATGPAVEVSGLTIRYGSADQVTAVDGIDLVADHGEVLVVLGPNGAGKTSTIEALEGYRQPTSGRIRVLGLNPLTDHHQLTRRMGVMLQNGGVYPMLGPRQVLDLFASYYPDPLGTDHLLDLVALQSADRTPWRRLSGGEQQRLSLALALIGQPEVAFLDEPTAGVDPEGRVGIRAIIEDLRARGVCVVLTTHELTEAEKLADRIVILSSGRVILEGTPQTLTNDGGTTGFSFGAPPDLNTVSLAAAFAAGASVSQLTPGRYRVDGVAGPEATAALANWLAAHNAALTDLVIGRTLEEVYFAAVGAAAHVTDALEQPASGRRRARRAGAGRR